MWQSIRPRRPSIGMDNEDILEELGFGKDMAERMYREGKLGKRAYFETTK